MAWREVSVRDERRSFVDLVGLGGVPIAELCRRFGISRQTGHLWLRRARAGETVFDDRSHRPRSSPRRLTPAAEAAILSVRDEQPAWGARKIAAILARAGGEVAAVSTIHEVLRRHGRIPERAGGERASGRFERETPNALWQMDFKGRVRLACGTICHPLTVIDDHSRYAVGLFACADQRTATVRDRLEQVFRHHGLPEAIYVDNGSPWGGGEPGQWTPLRLWLLKLGVETIHARPYHPEGRGKNERFHRSLKAEVFDRAVQRGLGAVQSDFDRWRRVYNHRRPHQALAFDVPASRWRPSSRGFPEVLPEPDYAAHDETRRVSTTKAYVSFRGRSWRVPKAFVGQIVAIRPTELDHRFDVCWGAHRIARIDLLADTDDTD